MIWSMNQMRAAEHEYYEDEMKEKKNNRKQTNKTKNTVMREYRSPSHKVEWRLRAKYIYFHIQRVRHLHMVCSIFAVCFTR